MHGKLVFYFVCRDGSRMDEWTLVELLDGAVSVRPTCSYELYRWSFSLHVLLDAPTT